MKTAWEFDVHCGRPETGEIYTFQIELTGDEPYVPTWAWKQGRYYSEDFASAEEAMQDAIREAKELYAQASDEKAAEEERKYGTYEQQIEAHYKATRL